MQAVIMAGGKGTRLQSISKDIPKPMFPVLGKPILEYQIESLKKSSIIDITIVIGHLGSFIKDYFDDGKKYGVHIKYLEESMPLGTAGALFYLKEVIDDDFVLLFGDLMLDVDWERFATFHRSHNSYLTLFGHPNSHPFDSDVLECDENGLLINILSKNSIRDFNYNNLVNAGVYCVSKRLLCDIKILKKMDFEKDIIAKYISGSNIYVYRSSEYVKDMGTPERLVSVTNDCKTGIITSRSLKNKQKAIFLDRDGTINVLKGFLKHADDFELIQGVSSAIKMINASNYLTIVTTNQPVVARGECTLKELNNIHKKMETLLGQDGAYIDGLYFCPHHPDKGFVGEVASLKIDCPCRKPKIGMLVEAARQFNIDLSSSWYVGDTTTDIKTGKNASMHTCLVLTGEAGKDGKYNVEADLIAKDLKAAISLILGI